MTTTLKMPALFIGHGSPMNAIEKNRFSDKWRELGEQIPKPKAILCISAHWETTGSKLTSNKNSRTIHDFGGFPKELFAVEYPCTGSDWLIQEIIRNTKSNNSKASNISTDESWGIDHGCWSVLNQMYPLANIPVVQLSLDTLKTPAEHFELGKELVHLREKGVLIIGSGNLVHHLGRLVFKGNMLDSMNEAYGLPWAVEANTLFKNLISNQQFMDLANYKNLGSSVQLAIPTREHFLPLLYVLAQKEENDSITFFNDDLIAGSLSMTSVVIGSGNL